MAKVLVSEIKAKGVNRRDSIIAFLGSPNRIQYKSTQFRPYTTNNDSVEVLKYYYEARCTNGAIEEGSERACWIEVVVDIDTKKILSTDTACQ